MTDAPLENLPRFIEPMLATGGLAPDGDGWALEVKFDGMRAQVRHDGTGLCGRSVILDGELVCFGSDCPTGLRAPAWTSTRLAWSGRVLGATAPMSFPSSTPFVAPSAAKCVATAPAAASVVLLERPEASTAPAPVMGSAGPRADGAPTAPASRPRPRHAAGSPPTWSRGSTGARLGSCPSLRSPSSCRLLGAPRRQRQAEDDRRAALASGRRRRGVRRRTAARPGTDEWARSPPGGRSCPSARASRSRRR